MSNIDTYLEQIFGKIERTGTNIPGNVSIVKLWLKFVGQLFEYHDNRRDSTGLNPKKLVELVVEACMDPNFIIGTDTKEGVLSASNFTESYGLESNAIHPEWAVICGVVMRNFLDNYRKATAAATVPATTSGPGPGAAEAVVFNKVCDKFFSDVLADTSGNKYVKILQRLVLIFVRKTRNTYEKRDTLFDYNRVIAEIIRSLRDRLGAAEKKYNKMIGGAPQLEKMKQIIETNFGDMSIYKSIDTPFERFVDLNNAFLAILGTPGIPLSILSSYSYAKVFSKILKSEPEKSKFFTDETTGRKFVRKAPGDLYEIKNGRETKINISDFKFASDFSGVGVMNDAKQTASFENVTQYYDKCLSGTLGNADNVCFDINYVSANDDLDKMDVSTLLLIIKQFEIPRETAQDPVTNSRVVMLKGYDDWMKVVEQKVSPTQFDVIKANASLRKYIEILVSYFNTHLQLLNPGYKIQQDERLFMTKPSPLGLAKILYRDNKMAMTSTFSSGDIFYLTNEAYKNLDALKEKFNPYGVMTGGAYGNVELPNSINPIADLLKNEMEHLRESLKAKGKQIAEEDNKDINKRLEDLKQKEDKLIKLHQYISEYNDLLELRGPQSDSMLEISVDNLIKFNKLYKDKIPKVIEKQLSLTSILEALTKTPR